MDFIFDNGFLSLNVDDFGHKLNEESRQIISELGLNYTENISPLIEAGLLATNNYFAGEFEDDTSVTFANSEIFCVIKGAEGQEPIIFDPYILTTSGAELYNIIKIASDFKTYSEYCICCIKELKMKYKNADFTVLRNKGNDMEDVDI